METNVLNDILESAFHTVINDPNVINDFNARFNNNNGENNSSNENEDIHEENDTERETSSNSNFHSHTNEQSVIRDYLTFFSNYNENMRIYSYNIGQMNRCLSNMIVNASTLQNISQPPLRSRTQRRRNNNSGINNTLSSMFPATHIRFLTPNSQNNTTVNTAPSVSELMNQTRIFVYNDETRIGMSSEQCSITLNNFSEGDIVAELNHCKHVFKMESLFTWFSRNSQCPVCRHNISD